MATFGARFYFLSAAFIAYVAYIVTDGFDIELRALFRNQVADRRRALEIEEEIIEQGQNIIHEFCGGMGDCYKVVDRAYRHGENLKVQRDIVPDKIQTASLSQAMLVVPDFLTDDNANSATWDIDRKTLITPYVMVMIASGYMIEALSFTRSHNKVIAFGLGGGAMQNYLFQFPKAKIDVLTVEIDPDMVEVAKKFYGYVPTESNRIEITDGIVYAKEALARGELYDFIVLDACSNDKKDVVICPIEGFRNEETISAMAQIVNPTGGLVANIVAYENPDFKEEEIRKLFSKYFASCFLMKYLPEQRMLICSHRPEWTLKTQRKKFLANLRTQQEKLGIRVVDPLIEFNPA